MAYTALTGYQDSINNETVMQQEHSPNMTRDMTHQLIAPPETSQTAAGWQQFSDALQGLCVQYREWQWEHT